MRKVEQKIWGKMLPIEKMDKDRTSIKTGIGFPIMNSEVQGKNDHRLVFVMSMMSLFVVIERTLILVLFSNYSLICVNDHFAKLSPNFRFPFKATLDTFFQRVKCFLLDFGS